MAIVVIGGAIANKYGNGGEAWVRLSWALGLKKLGFRVYFVEQISRENCIDAAGTVTPFKDCVNLSYFEQVTQQFGLSGSATLIYDNGQRTHGLTLAELQDLATEADLLVNISGHLSLEPLMTCFRRKVYIDIDPGFTQFWHDSGALRLQRHDFYFTIGENIGTPACEIPTSGIRWQRTRQPVVLDHWPVSMEGVPTRFTTVASWRGPFGRVQYRGKTFGLKVHEFRKFIQLPRQSPYTYEIALDIHPEDGRDLEMLRDHGWQIVDPKEAAGGPMAFRRYIQGSGAEFSVAQGIYVETGSGWFSDRSVRYLASGKPVLVQDTGFSRNLPVGEGLLTFRTLEQAISGAERIASDYDIHCRAARALAETYFDSNKILGALVEEVGVAP